VREREGEHCAMEANKGTKGNKLKEITIKEDKRQRPKANMEWSVR